MRWINSGRNDDGGISNKLIIIKIAIVPKQLLYIITFVVQITQFTL